LAENLPAGPHLLRWTAQLSEGKATAVVTPWEWNPLRPQPVTAAAIKPGLYKVEMLNKRTQQPSGGEALVLVCNAETYVVTSKAFAEALAITKTWDESSRQSGQRAFLESYLEVLADPNAR
jgi:hypothetical protein